MARVPVYNIEKKSFFWYKIIPGVITALILTSPVWTSILGIYDLLIIYLAFLATFILFKSTQQMISNIKGYQKKEAAQKRDWQGDLLELDLDELPKYKDTLPTQTKDLNVMMFIPIYKETYEYLKEILDSIADQDYPFMDKVIPVLAVEDRAGEKQKKIVNRLVKEFKGKFGDIWIFYHPEGIEGEIVGDACANLRWAGIQASKKMQKLGMNSKHTIFNKCDSDTRFHPKYISAFVYTYLTSPKRSHKFYSPAILIYSNNYWQVPGLIRVFSSALTLGIVNEWLTAKSQKQSFSCYGANFHLLEKINFWDASTGAEDTYFFWNAFLHLNGDFEGECFWLPVTMDAVEGENQIDAFRSLYKQQLRWGWGVLIMPLSIQGMIWNKKIGFFQKIKKIFLLSGTYNFLMTVSILLTFSIPVLTLLNQELEYSSVTYLLPRTISHMITASMLFQIPSKYYLWKFYGAPPKDKSLLFKIWWWGFEHFLMIVNVWTYYLLPRIQAQIEMTFGKKRKKFFASAEGRIKEED
jgi:cellulose synthase/poly-beta-1,6-N-acetylglucosamine synthase-like glycosyltransferase